MRYSLCLSFVIVSTCVSQLMSDITFGDGNDHLVSAGSVISDAVRISNATHVEIDGQVDVVGCTGFKNPECSTSGYVVRLIEGSHLDLRGDLTGDPEVPFGLFLTDSSMNAYAGTVHASAKHSNGVVIVGDSYVNLLGTDFVAHGHNGFANGMLVDSTAVVQMFSGNITGMGTEISGTGLVVSEQAQFDLFGGTIHSEIGAGFTIGAGVDGYADLSIRGGQITSEVSDRGSSVQATWRSHLWISDGTMDVTSSTSASVLELLDRSKTVVAGGQLIGRADDAVVAVRTRDNASAYISAMTTDLISERLTNPNADPSWKLDLEAHDESEIIVAGQGFNYPTDEPIQDEEGVITGSWAHGEPFSLSFYRIPEATIRLVEGVLGDYDGDRKLTAADIDVLSIGIANRSDGRQFDLNRDGTITVDDRKTWIHRLFGTHLGDANLDGKFDSADLVSVFQANQYHDAIVGNSTWSTGDWNGDREFTSSDFVVAFQDGGFEQGPNVAFAVLPEPLFSAASLGLLIWLLGNSRGRS